jgi:hypothetical protein
MDFGVLENRILSRADREQGSGASAEEILNAEQKLSIQFIGGFRRFLEKSGWIRVGLIEVYGIGADVPKHLNLVKITISERSEMRPSLRHELIPVMNDGRGNLYCLGTAHSVDSQVPIVFWDHELSSNRQPEKISKSFEEWLDRKLRDF